MQADPIGQIAGGDANVYAYVGNIPTGFTDPDGLFSVGLSTPVGVAAAGAPATVAAAVGTAGLVGIGLGVLIEPLVQPYVETAADYYFGDPLDDEQCDRHNCDAQYENDLNTCRAIGRQGQKKRAALCYESALLRKIACEQGKPIPPLSTWSN